MSDVMETNTNMETKETGVTKEKMSVYKALTRKATIKKQIDEFKSSMSPRTLQLMCPVKKHSQTLQNGMPIADYELYAKSQHQKFNALLNNFKALDAAIAQFNATCEIKVAGKEMTVLAAIQRKAMLPFEKSILDKYRKDYLWATNEFQTKNSEVEEKADAHVRTSLGDKGSRDEDVANNIRTSYIEKNGYIMVDPIGMAAYLEKALKDLEDFECDVNSALTEANASHEIEVDFID